MVAEEATTLRVYAERVFEVNQRASEALARRLPGMHGQVYPNERRLGAGRDSCHDGPRTGRYRVGAETARLRSSRTLSVCASDGVRRRVCEARGMLNDPWE